MPVSSRTLDGIKKKLTVKAESVTVIYVHDDWDYGRRVAAIIKVVREKSGRLRNAENGVMIERFPTLYVLDPDVYAEIKLLERQRDSISDQISDAYSRLSRFR
jgi:hypothetical protein